MKLFRWYNQQSQNVYEVAVAFLRCNVAFCLVLAYGLLLNSSWASRFVLGEGKIAPKTSDVTPPDPWGEESSGEGHPLQGAIMLEGGDMDVFLIHGPDYPSILRSYASLVGRPPVIPKWELGYMQSKFGYKDQDEALEVANEMRRRGIPGDVDCTWEVLKDQIVVGQQVNISGQPWWGTDVGGCMYKEPLFSLNEKFFDRLKQAPWKGGLLFLI